MPKQIARVRALVFFGIASIALTGFPEISAAQNTSGLVAFPNSLNYTVPYPQGSFGPPSCASLPVFPVVTIQYNGAPVTIGGVFSSTGGDPNWLQPTCIVSLGNQSAVNVGLTLTGLSPGNYTGLLTMVTTAGAIVVQVNLTYTTAVVCFPNGGISTPARFEGLSEIVGDFFLNCNGGAPTPLGSPIP